ncbi:unnamed protein product [Toxocara canis]|uniref:NLE domain-containing protein n=1 Tax=Toxocara canis TaxID=6265 RepID=A0A183VC58_TOXCA|nr:unnamed protein product [Toxocara canis]
MEVNEDEGEHHVGIRLYSEDGNELSDAPIVVSLSTSNQQLQVLCNKLLGSSDDPIPISFRLKNGVEIVQSIADSVPQDKLNAEKVRSCFF